jgi:hypothetical protein
MRLVHKSINIREDIWRQLRVNAHLSGCSVRAYLTHLIEQSQPLPPEQQSIDPEPASRREGSSSRQRRISPKGEHRANTCGTSIPTASDLLNKVMQQMQLCGTGTLNAGENGPCQTIEPVSSPAVSV